MPPSRLGVVMVRYKQSPPPNSHLHACSGAKMQTVFTSELSTPGGLFSPGLPLTVTAHQLFEDGVVS